MTLTEKLRSMAGKMPKVAPTLLEAAERIEALELAICFRRPQQDGTAGQVDIEEEDRRITRVVTGD